ncbi:hypothetical protein [Mycolicibacterium sp.]|uniref:hypothetical protein n=1 Tax=Mycolicibacterium sp. TaxID=2320850 RepID=UPI001A1AA874|nr:hypothetical protein [Mycolicibacterium sp.]MBJ7339240.1 hypothetical protein [Mycolicibacterium sp.]
MVDRHKRSAAKQARRDARRSKARRGRAAGQDAPEEVPLVDEVREALAGGDPMDLLGLVSMVIVATAPQPELPRAPETEEILGLDELVDAFIDVRVAETTALLAVLGELVMDDDVLRDRCRREVETRTDDLPPWLAALAQTTVHEAVRMTHVLGDGDEVLLGVRLADGGEMTCAIHIDHLEMSEVKDAFFVPNSLDAVVDIARASNTDPDTSFVDLDLSEARARLEAALEQHLAMFPPADSDTWPACRPLVQWLTRLMPDDFTGDVAQRHSTHTEALVDRFFASVAGMAFDDVHHRALLDVCIDEGTGDALRWSAMRLRQLLGDVVADPGAIPVDPQLNVPELLRAFVPFAHAESGIRQELTAEALAAIDESADGYRELVLEDAEFPGLSDD